MSMFVPGYRPWALTRTIHRAATPEQWRAVMQRWRNALVDRGWAEVWRAELQRRKVPHAHSALWVPEDVELDQIRDLWLACTREQDDPDAVEHAICGKPLPGGAWAAYMAAHAGKSKQAQLGWCGKQWGVIGRGKFVRMPGIEADVTPDEARWFTRFLRRWAASRYRDKSGRRLRIWAREQGFARVCDGSAVPQLLTAARRILTLDPDPMRSPF